MNKLMSTEYWINTWSALTIQGRERLAAHPAHFFFFPSKWLDSTSQMPWKLGVVTWQRYGQWDATEVITMKISQLNGDRRHEGPRGWQSHQTEGTWVSKWPHGNSSPMMSIQLAFSVTRINAHWVKPPKFGDCLLQQQAAPVMNHPTTVNF